MKPALAPSFKQFAKRHWLVKKLVGARRARATRELAGRWESWLGASPLPAERDGPRVLLATSLGGWQPGTRLDTALAVALALRGGRPGLWLCDRALPVCQMADVYFYPRQGRLLAEGPQRDMCAGCYGPAAELYGAIGVPTHRLGDTLRPEEESEAGELAAQIDAGAIPTFEIDGVGVGEHALAGALRFFARGDLLGEPKGEAMLRAYFEAALRTYYAIDRLLAQEGYERVVLHHGIYVPQGVIAEVARRRDVPVVTWHPAYRRNCFTFADGDTYHRAMIPEPTSTWENMEWSPAHDAAIVDYLESRWKGSRDWISFNRDPDENLRGIAEEFGLDRDKPWIGLLTSVTWDAQLHYPGNAFASVVEWVRQSIDIFAARPDLQLVIRVHPAEVRGRLPSRQRVADEIARAVPELPGNVAVIPPESRVSTYALLSACDAALIYATKTGIELTSVGIPTIVAGEAWIRDKGFSIDVSTPAEYRAAVDRLPLRERMPAAQVERARKYAFHYFFRRMIPLDFVHQASNRSLAFDLDIEGVDELRPGRHAGLDVICDGILQGSGFIFPAERHVDRVAGVPEPEPHQAVL